MKEKIKSDKRDKALTANSVIKILHVVDQRVDIVFDPWWTESSFFWLVENPQKVCSSFVYICCPHQMGDPGY